MMMPRLQLNLDIDLVRSFATIVSLGNFTRAAQALGLQQSTISLQIRRLELLVGSRLLERSPQSIALTAEGEMFFDYARRMLDLHLRRLAGFGLRTVFLEVEEGNVPARKLYARAGFHEVGRRPGYYPQAGAAKAAMVLRRDLV